MKLRTNKYQHTIIQILLLGILWLVFCPILSYAQEKKITGLFVPQSDKYCSSFSTYTQAADYSLLWQTAAAALILIIMVLWWNRRLGREVTERRVAQLALAAAEERSRLLLESVTEGIFGLDLAGQVTFVNPAGAMMLGYSVDELVGQAMHPLVHHTYPDGTPYPREKCYIFLTVHEGMSNTIDNEVLWRKDGSSFAVEYSSVPISKEGRNIGAVVVFRDISNRLAAQERLEARERQFRSLIESAPDAMVMTDSDGQIVMINRRTEQVFGYQRDALVGKSVEMLMPQRLRQQHAGFIDSYIRQPQARAMGSAKDIVGLTKTGREIPLEVSLSPIETDDGLLIASSLRDISERKEAQAAIREGDLFREKMAETERFNRLAVAREQRIIELKQQVNQFAEKSGQAQLYADLALEQMEIPDLYEEPLDNVEDIDLTRILDIQELQSLLEQFCDSIGLASTITDLQGNKLAAAHWQRACTDFHQSNEMTCAGCTESNANLSLSLQKGKEFSIYHCNNGLVDCGAPINIAGKHVANVFIGHFLLDKPDWEYFRKQAEEVGFEMADYLGAIADVPVIEKERLPKILGFLSHFANVVASLSLERQRASHAEQTMQHKVEEFQRERMAAMNLAEDAEQARTEVAQYRDYLEVLIEERSAKIQAIYNHSTDAFVIIDKDFRFVEANPAVKRMFNAESAQEYIDMFNTMSKWIVPSQPVSDSDKVVAIEEVVEIPKLSGVDTQLGLATTQGNSKLYRKLLLKFAASQSDFATQFRQAQMSTDPEAMTRCAHSLKGVAGNLGAKEIQMTAQALETACKDQQSLEKIDKLLKTTIETLTPVLTQINQFRQSMDSSLGQNSPAELNREQFASLMRNLKKLLEDDDTDAGDVVDDIMELGGTGEYKVILKQLSDAIDDYDFEQALIVMEKLQSLWGDLNA